MRRRSGFGWLELAIGIILILLGALALARPDLALTGLVFAYGIAAVVMGVAPPKGVPMPLMSYGGSNLMATMLCVGLLMNFSRTATGKEGSIWKESS